MPPGVHPPFCGCNDGIGNNWTALATEVFPFYLSRVLIRSLSGPSRGVGLRLLTAVIEKGFGAAHAFALVGEKRY